MIAASLVACGGGASGDVVNPTPGQALYTTAPSSVTLVAGQVATYKVGGGSSQFVSYKVSSSNSSVVDAALAGTQLTFTAKGSGTASVSVTDSSGTSVVVSVTVTAAAAQSLQVAAPQAVTLVPGNAAQYKVSGGVAPYTVVSSNPNVAVVAVSGNNVSVTAANPGTAIVAVFDENNTMVEFSVTVTGGSTNVPLYTTAPQTVNLGANATASYVIAGGTGPYVASSSRTDVLGASVSGSSLTLQATGLAGSAAVDIVDAAGARVTLAVNVGNGTPVALYTTMPAALALGVGPSPSYQIVGGVGPYSVSTSNPGVASASVSGSTLSVTGLASGTAQIVVFDSTGATASSDVTVAGGSSAVPLYTTAPDSITVRVGAAPTYTIAGGAAPYAVTSSDVAVATVSQAGNAFTVTGVGAGTAQVVIRDANGGIATVNVTVN